MVFSFLKSFKGHATMHEGHMTTARAQPLLATFELTKAHEFLCEAAILVSDVKSLLVDSSNCAMAARLNDIQGRLADEVQAVERLIAADKPRYTIERSAAVSLMCMAVTRRGRQRSQGRA